MSLGGFLLQACNVERVTNPGSRDSMGGEVAAWGALIANMPCMIQALNANERAMFGGAGVDVSHRLFCEVQTETLTARDRVRVGEIIYGITHVDNVAGLSDHLEITLQEIQHGEP
mgnify:CR=1 FL=1